MNPTLGSSIIIVQLALAEACIFVSSTTLGVLMALFPLAMVALVMLTLIQDRRKRS